MTLDKIPLAETLRRFISTEIGVDGTVPPKTLRRWSVEELVDEFERPREEIQNELDTLVKTTAFERDNPRGGLAYVVRRHHDGRYSCSTPSAFEYLLQPDPFELEKQLSSQRFDEADEALAAIEMARPGAARDAPQLHWADNRPLSTRAADWYYAQLLAKKFYIQRDESDKRRPVRDAHDLLRDAFNDESATALAGWLIERSDKSPRREMPRHRAALEVVVERYLEPNVDVPDWISESIIAGGHPGTAWLLRYGAIGVDNRLRAVHAAWPDSDDITGPADLWEERMLAFLKRAFEAGTRIPGPILEPYYLSNPLMAPLLEDALFEARDSHRVREPDELIVDAATGMLSRPVDGRDMLRIEALDRHQPPEKKPAVVIAELPKEPLSVAEYNRRIKAAGLTQDPDPKTGAEAFTVDPEGTFRVIPAGHGSGTGSRRLLVFDNIRLEDGHRVIARLERDRREGWDSLDPRWKRIVAERLEILFSPAPLSLATESLDDTESLWTPLHRACDARDVELVEATLADSTRWVNTPSAETRRGRYGKKLVYPSGTTPLHIAAASQALELVDMLLQHGADPNIQDARGRTPLHRVGIFETQFLEQLLDAGADPSIENARGESFLTRLCADELTKSESRELAAGAIPPLAAAGADLTVCTEAARASRNHILVQAFADYGFEAQRDSEIESMSELSPDDDTFDFSPLLELNSFKGRGWLDAHLEDDKALTAKLLAALSDLELPKRDGVAFDELDALRWLELRGGPVDAPWLLAALEDEDAEIARAAARMLRAHDRDAARRHALSKLKSENADIRGLAVEELGELGGEDVVEALKELQEHETTNRVKRSLKKSLELLGAYA